MYCPAHFAQNDRAELLALMQAHPLATLITQGAEGVDATPVPLLWFDDGSAQGVLRGHLARANPVWRAVSAAAPVLVLFHGPGGYVTPSWYPAKREHGRVVPTWNYALVELRGQLQVRQDPAWLRTLLAQMTAHFEQGRADPWALDDAPADYIDAMLKAVVGIEIAIETLRGKWKMSQNQNDGNRAGVRAGFAAEPGAEGLSDWISVD